MYCSRCGNRNADDATYCDRCGADLRTMPTPPGAPGTPPPTTPPGPASSPAPVVYAADHRHVWWFPIGVWAILSAFFLFLDLMTSAAVTWSVWPVGVIGIFLVGIPLLRRLEEWSLNHARARGPR